MDALGPLNGDCEPRELRRGYHDRIAELRERSLSVLRWAVAGTEDATQALLADDLTTAGSMRERARQVNGVAAAVDDEVVGLLALESPVARDLRVVLAARDVTQVSLLCVGLALTLANRAGALGRVPALREEVERAGSRTAALMRLADAAWATLDADTAGRVLSAAADTRSAQVDFLEALLTLNDAPLDAALDLGLVARAYDRLTDHAEEIAERVLFAVHGRHTPVSGG